MKIKKTINQIKKTIGYPFPIYFQLIHALGLFFGSALITNNIIIAIFPILEAYKVLIFTILYLLLIGLSWAIGHKDWMKGMSIWAFILIIIHFLWRPII